MKKLIQLVEMDCVATVIVSDISRVTRNHIEAAHYMCEFFPSHNARIIAVNEEPSKSRIERPKDEKSPHHAQEVP